ncbi:ribonuclease P protein component [Fervidobacterium thailandense]|uniref:Ribonuclease P protein component n=1 Tax=Fervidobacterium thailandense TaxID=1008305 RepID=A0A1E3G4Z7_9BACT|nr:ribonuclease P protein component [Fervidobacterium thailandense]
METDSLRFTFRKRERLKLRRDIKLLFEEGKSLQSQFFVVIFRKNGLDYSRIAVSVRKKFGKANRRNKVRRWVRECFRTNKQYFPKGFDMMFIVRRALSEKFEEVNYHKICEELLKLCARIVDEKNSALSH